MQFEMIYSKNKGSRYLFMYVYLFYLEPLLYTKKLFNICTLSEWKHYILKPAQIYCFECFDSGKAKVHILYEKGLQMVNI